MLPFICDKECRRCSSTASTSATISRAVKAVVTNCRMLVPSEKLPMPELSHNVPNPCDKAHFVFKENPESATLPHCAVCSANIPLSTSSSKHGIDGVVWPVPRGSNDRTSKDLSPSTISWIPVPALSNSPTPLPPGPPGLMTMVPPKEGSSSLTLAGILATAMTTSFVLDSSLQSRGTVRRAHSRPS